MAARSAPRAAAEDAFLDAAERLLLETGHAGITTRRLAEEAGVNHGLVHYYFGSMENLLARVLERFTERLIVRQRELYAADTPFLEKWRTAMHYLVEEDLAYQKVWLELQALGWNRPELRERIARVHGEWRSVLVDGFEQARVEHAIDIPASVLVTLVMTFNEGVILDRASGISEGHAELLEWIEERLGEGNRGAS